MTFFKNIDLQDQKIEDVLGKWEKKGKKGNFGKCTSRWFKSPAWELLPEGLGSVWELPVPCLVRGPRRHLDTCSSPSLSGVEQLTKP